ncbi:hypothetical protein SESBI_25793 [Sesbania bispinosa]|nr:hypothetical protein SESBI_25793 [Sesbania bispinosa]
MTWQTSFTSPDLSSTVFLSSLSAPWSPSKHTPSPWMLPVLLSFRIFLNKSPSNTPPPKDSKAFIDPLLTVALKSHGFIINNFVELDGEEYVHYYENTIGHKAWHLGPASVIRKTTQEKQRGEKRACAIEASGNEFIWVVPEKKGKEDESEEEKDKWLPKGFEERNGKKGMIIRGPWSAGVPMITWPVHSDQFYNEKLITQVRGIGVEVGAEEWNLSAFWENQKLVGRDRIEKAVRRLMDGGDEAETNQTASSRVWKKG